MLTPLWLTMCALIPQPVPWPDALSVSWGPHAARIPVTVTNLTDEAMAGEPLSLRVGGEAGELPIVGEAIASLRVCDERGVELLWNVTHSEGDGDTLRAGDAVTIPVSCGPSGSALLHVYVDNPRAWRVPDMLVAGLRNPGFEAVTGDTPTGWSPGLTDAQHRMAWAPDQGIDGSAAAVCVVEPGAEATWVAYRQFGIPLRGGAEYVFRAWVRAEEVEGTAGWFIHVNGDEPMLINEVMNAGAGTYGWREVRYEFTAPEAARDATIGTVLAGTGTVWYDNVSVEPADSGPLYQVSVGERESLNLDRVEPESGEWLLDVVNMGPEPRNLLVAANLRPAELSWRRSHGDFTNTVHAEVEAPGGGVTVEPVGTLGSDLMLVHLPAQTYASLPVTVVLDSAQPASIEDLAAELAAQPSNLARGALMDTQEDREAWGEARSEGATADSSGGWWPDGAAGTSCLRLEVPPETAPRWTGFRQTGLPLREEAHYLYGGLVRADELDGTASLHAHVMDAEGAVLAYLGAGPAVVPHSEWTWVSTVFRAPPGARSIDLHLTTNTWGTLYYDSIVLHEVAAPLDLRPAPAPLDDLRVGVVDPIIKVFPQDIPPPAPATVDLQSARNEHEVLQVAVRLPDGADSFTWEFEPFSGPGENPRVARVERVGYVPVDSPTCYRRSDGAPWERRVGAGSAGSDGWPGRWPDPLLPLTGDTVEVPEGETTALWITLYTPPDAGAGDHSGRLTVSSGGESIDLDVSFHVWDFGLSDDSRTTAIYDLRVGPSGTEMLDLGDDEVREAWYRLMAEHRVCPDMPGPEPVFRYEDGQVSMDAREFDRWARLCLDELGMRAFYSPWTFYALGWAYRPGERFGLEPLSDEYVTAMQSIYRLYIDHLTEMGWRDRLIHYVSDEPFDSVPQVVDDLREFCTLYEAVAPDVPRYSSTWHPSEGLEGAITMWGAGHYGVFPVEKMEARRAAGDRILFTTDGQMCIDTPYLTVERLLPHYAYHYGAEGYEFWGVSWWTYDPLDFGWHDYITQNDGVGENYYVRYPNGDGYLAYPGERYGVRGPLASIRLALAREGLEDGEYLHTLSDLVSQLGDRSDTVPEAAEALALARELVPIPNDGGLRSSLVLPDPTRVGEVRSRLAAAIESCRAALEE